MTYHAKCNNCDLEGKNRVYNGETARNLYVRSKEHYSALQKKSSHSFMYKHIEKEHDGDCSNVNFNWQVIGKFRKPLERQLSEAIDIKRKPLDENLNSKNEFYRQNLNRIILNNEDKPETCGYCSRKFEVWNDLQKHEQFFHTRYQCKNAECGYLSFGERDLKHHYQTVHNS